jgi:hypothetical protein
MNRQPERAARVFLFGQSSTKFSTAFCRIVGRIFMVVFLVGAAFYLVLIPLDLFGVKFGE